jgi:DNA-directed RNA polymerase I subunit RPA2
MHGVYQDATPFRFHEKHRAVDYFGEQLVAAGYSYYGSEPLYSGITGTEMHADIYMGVVYYQRLRHMVSDKSQVRSTGPINNLTRQPVKGRKKGGGIRFGEMERDSLLAHGAAYLLHDRLMNSSDKHFAHVCTRCGSLISPIAKKPLPSAPIGASREMRCQSCNTSKSCAKVAMPYVFRFLANELAAMNVRVNLSVRSTT